jgi:hypothetical protein
MITAARLMMTEFCQLICGQNSEKSEIPLERAGPLLERAAPLRADARASLRTVLARTTHHLINGIVRGAARGSSEIRLTA